MSSAVFVLEVDLVQRLRPIRLDLRAFGRRALSDLLKQVDGGSQLPAFPLVSCRDTIASRLLSLSEKVRVLHAVACLHSKITMSHKTPPKMKRFGRLAMVPANKHYQFQSQLNQRCVLALLCNTSAQKKAKKTCCWELTVFLSQRNGWSNGKHPLHPWYQCQKNCCTGNTNIR